MSEKEKKKTKRILKNYCDLRISDFMKIFFLYSLKDMRLKRCLIDVNKVDIKKILTSDKVSYSKKGFKYFPG